MTQGRHKLIAWVVVGGIVACAWCSVLSGVAGWVLGQDLGWRAGRIEGVAEAHTATAIEPGVLVIRVDRGSPADRAGIAANDLITAVNGNAIPDSRALRDLVMSYRPGQDVKVTFLQDTNQRTVSVHLDRFPEADRAYLGIYFTSRAEEPGDV